MSRRSLICRLGVLDATKVVTRRGDQVTEINFIAADKRLDFGLGNALDYLAGKGFQPSERAADLLLLAGLLTAADTRVNRASESEDKWTREIALHLPVSEPKVWTTVAPVLKKTLDFLTGDLWSLHFCPRPASVKQLVPAPKRLRIVEPTSVCLLSGGLDSFIGAVDLLAAGEQPLFVSHYWDGTTSVHQSYCLDRLKAHYKIQELLSLRAHIGFREKSVGTDSSEDTQRGRSFLFFAMAALAASGLGRKTVIYVPENGLISLNVPLDPLRLGALSTRTTHPYYMARWNQLFSELGIDAVLENPYRFQTKGAMVANCKDKAFLKRYAKNTMSCSHPVGGRYKGESPGHCGRCVPCLIRRGSLKAAFGSDDTPYKIADLHAAPLNSEKAEGEHIRSFQLAISRLEKRPSLARLLIHQPGSLSEYSDADIKRYEAVYRDGLAEVEKIVKGVVCKPL
jgi:7-cyano-7-deazaguanine synthase in queuosine biosynthesis